MVDLAVRAVSYVNEGFTLSGTAPHTSTLRLTFTVPDGRYFTIENITLGVRRATAASTAGVPETTMYLTMPGGSARVLRSVSITGNTVGTSSVTQFPGRITIPTASTITVYTVDTSTGGTCDFYCTIYGFLWR